MEFSTRQAHYSYEIGPDGTVRKSASSPISTTAQSGGASGTDIGRDGALQAALDYAGVAENQAANVKVERDSDDGKLEYEVAFWVNDTEYDCTVDGSTGAVRDFDMEQHASASQQDIGYEGAKQAALAHAGLQESQTSRWKVEQDEDDGRLEYEVAFSAGNVEYEYTIDAASGAILEHEADWED